MSFTLPNRPASKAMETTAQVKPVLLGLMAMWSLALAGCGQHQQAPAAEAPPEDGPPAEEVVVVPAQLATWPETIRVQGSMLAFEEAVVGSKLAGRVQEVRVDLGSVVKKGDVLVQLVQVEHELRLELAEAQLRQACAAIGITPDDDESKFEYRTAPGAMMEEALVNEAQANVDRARQLVASRTITQSEYDTLIAQLKAAQARYNAALNAVGEQVSLIGVRRKELALAQQTVIDSQVIAPFDGVVGERRISPGEFVQAGQAVVTLVRSDQLRFTAGVPESRAAVVRVGQRVEIERRDVNLPSLVTTITRVSPTVMPTSRAILIEADVPNPTLELQAGLFAEAELVVDAEAQAIVIPATAVSHFAGVEKVWVVEEGVARQQTIRTGRERDGEVEVLGGLGAGLLVVRHAAEGHDGPVVAIEQTEEQILQARSPDGTTSLRNGNSSGAQ